MMTRTAECRLELIVSNETARDLDNATAQIAEKRLVSSMLADFLIEDNMYSPAADLALGMESVFAGLASRIEQLVREVEEFPQRISFEKHLKPVLDECRAEINYNRKWFETLQSTLPFGVETSILREAFNTVAIARNKLLVKVMKVHDEFLERQALAFQLKSDK